MARANPLQPSSPSLATGKPVVANGKKTKLDPRKHQQPSVRIYRDSASNYKHAQQIGTDQHGDAAAPATTHSSPSNDNSFAGRIRSLFGSAKSTTDAEPSKHEYDIDTVDLLDVVGMYYQSKPALK